MDAASGELQAAAVSARRSSDFLALERIGREMIARGEATGSREAVAWGHYHLGIALTNLNRGVEAERITRAALVLFKELGDEFAAARVMMNLAAIEMDNHLDAAAARRLYDAAEPAIRASGEPERIAIAVGNFGEILRLEGDYEGALRKGLESLEIFLSTGDEPQAAWQLINVAHYYALMRNDAAAVESMHRAHAILERIRDPRWIGLYFDTWMVLGARFGEWEAVAQLQGFVDRFRDENNQPRLQIMLPWLSEPKEKLSRMLSHEQMDELIARGEALTFDGAQRLVEEVAHRHVE